MSNSDTDNTNPLPLRQNINVAQTVAVLASFLVVFTAGKINLSLADQATIVLAIQSLAALYTMLVHTFVNHPANGVAAKAYLAKAVNNARGLSSGLLVIFLAASVFLGGCASGGIFSNPQNDLNAARIGFSTALALYNSVCGSNRDLAICTQANLDKAASLEQAVTDALDVAGALLAINQGATAGAAPTAQQIADAIQKVTDAVTAFNGFANQLQVQKATRAAARAHASLWRYSLEHRFGLV